MYWCDGKTVGGNDCGVDSSRVMDVLRCLELW